MPARTQGLDVWMGPQSAGARDNLRAPILETIADARDEILLATQQLEDPDVLRALVHAERRGVRCRVLLESDYLSERQPVEDPTLPGGKNEANRAVFLALLRARIPVRTDRSYRLMHMNFLVADRRDPARASVCVTTANLSPSGLDIHRNMLIRLAHPVAAAEFGREFEAIWDDTPPEPDDQPIALELGGLRVSIMFGPNRHRPERELVRQVIRAGELIQVSVFTFSTGSALDDLLVAASRQGLGVQVLIDKDQVDQVWAATDGLLEGGAEVGCDSMFGKLHHKIMAIDRSVILTGTFNYTATARNSHELLMTLQAAERTPEQAHPVVQFCLDEVDRLWTSRDARTHR